MEAARDLLTPDRQRLLESYLSGAASALSNLRLLDRMKQQANIDMLTGLYNRRFLEDYARKLFAIARRRDQPVGFIMMDLDHFKSFNDLYGHEVGDRILRHFAKTVTSSMRETNLAARYGGEEFVVILPGHRSEMLHAGRRAHSQSRHDHGRPFQYRKAPASAHRKHGHRCLPGSRTHPGGGYPVFGQGVVRIQAQRKKLCNSWLRNRKLRRDDPPGMSPRLERQVML